MPAEGRGFRWKGWRKGAGSGSGRKAYYPDERAAMPDVITCTSEGGRPVRSPSSGRQQVWRRTGRPAQGCELGATARDTRPLAAPGTPVCEPHDSTGEPGAGNRPAGFGERGEETCLRDSDCGPVRKRRMSHRTLPVTRLPSTLRLPRGAPFGRPTGAPCRRSYPRREGVPSGLNATLFTGAVCPTRGPPCGTPVCASHSWV